MQDKWYGDNRDLVKWSILHLLADHNHASRILQVVYYRPSVFKRIVLDKQEWEIPHSIRNHFRNHTKIENLASKIAVSTFSQVFSDRKKYIEDLVIFLHKFTSEKCIVFLDPDVGLEPQGRPELKHVLNSEAKTIWDEMKAHDWLVIYQHQTNRAGKPWIDDKRIQLADAIGVKESSVLVADGKSIINDVVFLYCEKN